LDPTGAAIEPESALGSRELASVQPAETSESATVGSAEQERSTAAVLPVVATESPTASDACGVAVAVDVPTGAAASAGEGVEAVGARLRAAREARGLTREALAMAARLPLSVIGHIEAGRFEALGAPIYARGFLRSYARAVDIPEVVVDAALRNLRADEPTLVVANPASLMDRFAARYKNPLVYALLTLVVVVPLVFIATPQAPRDGAQAFAPLDADLAPTDRSAAKAVPRTPSPHGSVVEGVAAPEVPPAPVMASMAPVAAPIAAPRSPGSRILVLKVSEPSWVELTLSDGRRLEYAQLPAGTTREYVFEGGADLVVGYVPGVVATLNGRTIDLNAVANRNVARMRVGDAASATGQ
jgi:cytoskeleton protein RodZ